VSSGEVSLWHRRDARRVYAGLKTPGRRHSNKRVGLCARPARVLLSYTDAIYDSWHKRGVVLLYYMRRRISERTLALIRKSRISGVVTGTFEEFDGNESK
jgi:hypothetical protein